MSISKPIAIAAILVAGTFMTLVAIGMATYEPSTMGATTPPAQADTASSQGIQRKVVRRINHMTSCAKLQLELDTHIDKATRTNDPIRGEVQLAYGDVANERMRTVGCYGELAQSQG